MAQKTSLTPDEQAELARLLTKVGQDDGGYLPNDAYLALHKIIVRPTVEIFVYDQTGRFVLTHRDDDFHGWHTPGGDILPNETIEEAVTRHVRKERITEAVRDIQFIAVHPWLRGEHPFSFPLSQIIACQAVDQVIEREDMRWFRESPPDLIQEQPASFIRHFQWWHLQWRRPCAAVLGLE